MNQSKLLFLDIDGVLNCADFLRAAAPGEVVAIGAGWDFPDHIDPAAVVRLNRVTDATGASIVISSSWRLMWPFGQLRRMLRDKGVTAPIIGKTPDLMTTPRAHEIRAYLNKKKHVPRFAIVDDDSDAGEGYASQFVRTSFDHGGLLDEHADMLIAILGERRELTEYLDDLAKVSS